MAASYAAANDTNVFNSLFERPATIALLGEVTGRMALEVGCGAGPLTDWQLRARGGAVRASRRSRGRTP